MSHLSEPDIESEPASKKLKLSPQASLPIAQPSFLDVLEGFNSSEKSEATAEGGNDRWQRPVLPPIDPRKDKIIFQQIDVDYGVSGSLANLCMYGVTEEGHAMYSRENLLKVEVVHKKSLIGYSGDNVVPFLKLTVDQVNNVPKMFERGECTFQGLFAVKPESVITFEGNIPHTLRFMIDTKVVGMNWIEIPAGNYQLVTPDKKYSHFQIEIIVKYNDFISHASEGAWSKHALLRILSFDIECLIRGQTFPEAKFDSVIQIANMVTFQGEQQPFIRNVFTLDTCANIVGTQVICFTEESAMLAAWQQFVEQVDPDVITGFNISMFDIPYLIDARAEVLGVDRFPCLGRIKGYFYLPKRNNILLINIQGVEPRSNPCISHPGRMVKNPLKKQLLRAAFSYVLREYKLNSYSLSSVCSNFDEKKEDVHFSQITKLQKETPESRRCLAVYCLKDAYLPQRLLDKLMCFVNYIEMSRVTGVPFNFLLTGRRSIKVLSIMYRKANEEGYLIPSVKGEGMDEHYEKPGNGYFDVTISPSHFSSSYPSIMVAHNLCYTTLLDKNTVDRLKLMIDVDYNQTPNNDLFATALKEGLLPTMLKGLTFAREQVEADQEDEKDPFKRAVLKSRQLALKTSADLVYGFTIKKLPCLAISSSVIAYGRAVIEKTKQVL